MKHLLTTLTILLSITVQGQKTNSAKKILIGFNFSPDYDFRMLRNGDGSASTDFVIKDRNDYEVAKFGYTAGVKVSINFSKLAQFETGIQLSNKGYQRKYHDLYFFQPDPSSPIRSKVIYAFHYIGVPFVANFAFGRGKISFLSSVGCITNFFLKLKVSSTNEYSDGRIVKLNQSTKWGRKKIDISPLLSFGIDYKLNDKMHLRAQPTFSYGIIKTMDAPVSEHLWNTGLNFAFYYVLR